MFYPLSAYFIFRITVYLMSTCY